MTWPLIRVKQGGRMCVSVSAVTAPGSFSGQNDILEDPVLTSYGQPFQRTEIPLNSCQQHPFLTPG